MLGREPLTTPHAGREITMRCYIIDTGTFADLDIFDSQTGVNYSQDLIGNTGGLCDGQFTWDADRDAYECNAETYAWWADCFAAYQALDRRIADLRRDHDNVDLVVAELSSLGGNFEDTPRLIMAELEERYGDK